MDEKDFKKHLQDLEHGHHHPEEHDWPEHGKINTVDERTQAKPSKAKRRPAKPLDEEKSRSK